MIRVLLVDDSPLALAMLQRMLATAADVLVVGAVGSGKEALAMVERQRPDVVCTDLFMPGMDGLELTRRLLAIHPIPILVVSVSLDGSNPSKVFELLAAGAVDVLLKPAPESSGEELVRKIRILAGVKVLRRSSPSPTLPGPRPARPQIIAMAVSTGGPALLEKLLRPLPADYAIPIVCVQHISTGFLHGMMQWLSSGCRVKIRIAGPDQDHIEPGTVLFAPDDGHLEVEAGGRVKVSHGPPVEGHRPSATLLLHSVARVYGPRATAFVLTGMGSDGVAGLQAVARNGGMTVAQDEASCAVYGMPGKARETGAAQYVFTPAQIERYLLDVGGGGSRVSSPG